MWVPDGNILVWADEESQVNGVNNEADVEEIRHWIQTEAQGHNEQDPSAENVKKNSKKQTAYQRSPGANLPVNKVMKK